MEKTSVVLFNPFPKQEQFIALVMSGKYSFVFYGGSVRAGKTLVIIGLFILLCWFYPGSKYIICRKDIEVLKATTLKSFDDVVPRSITAKMPTAHNGWEWVCTNGSVIKFFSENIARDPNLMRFRGLEYDSIAFDEMDIAEETFRKSFERCGTWKMKERQQDMLAGKSVPPKVVIGTSNPQDGWVKEEIHNNHVDNTLPDGWYYLRARVYDNTKIPKEYVEGLKKSMLPEDFLKFVDGDWDVDKNRKKYFEYYDDKVHYSKESFDFEPNTETWLSFDFNYNPTTCTVYQVYDDGIVCLRNYGIEGGTRKLCTLILEDEKLMSVPKLLWTVTGDTSGSSKSSTAGDKTDYDIIQEVLGLHDMQFEKVHTRNKALMYSRRLCDWFLFKTPFTLDVSVTRLRNDLLIAKPDEGGGLYKNRDKGFGMDFLDTFRYFVDAKFPDGIDDINRFVELTKIKTA